MPLFKDRAIIISSKPLGENHRLLKLLCEKNGFKTTINYGGNSKTRIGNVQIANEVEIIWRGKSESSRGYVVCELIKQHMYDYYEKPCLMDCVYAVLGLMNDVHAHDEKDSVFYEVVANTLSSFSQHDFWAVVLAKFEIGVLSKLGYGLSLEECIVSNVRTDLQYISPKSGCAVSQIEGKKYKDKLFTFPLAFKSSRLNDLTYKDNIDALRVSGFFIEKYLYRPQNKELPNIRKQLYKSLIN